MGRYTIDPVIPDVKDLAHLVMQCRMHLDVVALARLPSDIIATT